MLIATLVSPRALSVVGKTSHRKWKILTSFLILCQKFVKITLELLSSKVRYICHQGGIWKIMGKAIFLVKGPSLIQIIVKALEAIQVRGKSPFFKYLSMIVLFCKAFFLYSSNKTILDFDLQLVYCIMQNYPVTTDWDKADRLDPLKYKMVLLVNLLTDMV